MIRVGIDPAFRKNGFGLCIIDYSDKTVRFIMFKKFIEFIAWVQSDMPENCSIVVENSNLQNETFDMKGGLSVVARKSRNVGCNQAISQITFELCKCYCSKVKEVSPKQKGAKWSMATALGVARAKGLKFDSAPTQDCIDAFQLALLY